MSTGGKILVDAWRRRLKHLNNIEESDLTLAEEAVYRLYAGIGLQQPFITWFDGDKTLHPSVADVPVRLIDKLLHALWFKLDDIDSVVDRLGYDKHTGNFRAAANKTILFGDLRTKRQRGRFVTRPPWSRNLSNMISQFDFPAMVLFDVVRESATPVEPRIAQLGQLISACLEHCFAMLLFEGWCLLYLRPRIISLDETQLLSSTSGPAYEDAYQKYFAVNGVIIPDVIDKRLLTWRDFARFDLAPRQRAAMISFIGWDAFYALTPAQNRTLIKKDRFGELYDITCGVQILTVVRVKNSTAEPDGSYRRYILPVDHDCRPLPHPADPNARMGEPQERTPLNAVASTFNQTGDHYLKILGAES